MTDFSKTVTWDEFAIRLYRNDPEMVGALLNLALEKGDIGEFMAIAQDAAKATGMEQPEQEDRHEAPWHDNIETLLRLADALNLRLAFVPRDESGQQAEEESCASECDARANAKAAGRAAASAMQSASGLP